MLHFVRSIPCCTFFDNGRLFITLWVSDWATGMVLQIMEDGEPLSEPISVPQILPSRECVRQRIRLIVVATSPNTGLSIVIVVSLERETITSSCGSADDPKFIQMG